MKEKSCTTETVVVRKGFYTLKESAAYFGVSEKSVRRLIGRGLLNPCVALRKILIPRDQLETFHSKNCLKSEDEEIEKNSCGSRQLKQKKNSLKPSKSEQHRE